MSSPKQIHQKKNVMQLVRLGILSVILGSGASGPKVRVCMVDAKNLGYQCVDSKNRKSFRPLDEDVGCSSPYDTEAFLKACKDGEILPITVCRYHYPHFYCEEPGGGQYFITVNAADNYACVSDQHRKRIQERCIHGRAISVLY